MAPVPEPRLPFWKRQWQGKPTWPQRIFDLVFGVVAPPLCLAFDPVVFTGPRSSELVVPAKLFICLEAGGMLLWLVLGGRGSFRAPLFAGFLGAGACFALVLGIAILPLSVFGLMFGIGILGFTPFLTCFAFSRATVRSLTRSEDLMYGPLRVAILMAGCLLAAVPPIGIQRMAERELELLMADPSRPAGWGERFGLLESERLLAAYEGAGDPVRRKALAGLYRRLTANDIELEIQRRDD